MQSETIGALAAALAKAQSQISGAVKDAANPFFKSKYADLESVWQACRKPLTDNGLAVTQTSRYTTDGLCWSRPCCIAVANGSAVKCRY